jgi:hypothetical protein
MQIPACSLSESPSLVSINSKKRYQKKKMMVMTTTTTKLKLKLKKKKKLWLMNRFRYNLRRDEHRLAQKGSSSKDEAKMRGIESFWMELTDFPPMTLCVHWYFAVLCSFQYPSCVCRISLKSGNGFLRYYTLPCHECGARQRERNS